MPDQNESVLSEHPLEGGHGHALADVLEETLALAAPGSQAEAVVLRQHLGVTRYTSRSIHQSVEDLSVRLWVRSWLDGGAGWASTADLSSSGLADVVGRAEASAAIVPGERLDLPSTASNGGPRPFFAATAAIDAAERARLAVGHIERAGSVEVNANLRVATQELALANSIGLRTTLPMTYAALNVVTRDHGIATWYETAIGRDIDALDLDGVVDEAVAGVGAAARPVAIEPGDYRVILDQPAVSMLLSTLGYVGLNAFGAGAVKDGSSFLAHHLGEAVASNLVTLRDEPTDPAALFMPFDAEGTARRSLDIIVDGTAIGPAYDRASAASGGVESTGHALPASMKTPSPLSLSIAAGSSSRDELLAALGDGLIVHRIHPFVSLRGGPNADLSGTSRDGLLVVEGGEVVGAANNVRWSNQMTDLFGSVEGVSSDRSVQWMDLPDHAPITNHVPSLLCGKLTVHGSQPRV